MSDDRRFPIQAEDVGRVHPRRPAGSVPWSVGVAAWERYAARYGRGQSAERIAERGGFGFGEMHLFLGPSWVEHFEAATGGCRECSDLPAPGEAPPVARFPEVKRGRR